MTPTNLPDALKEIEVLRQANVAANALIESQASENDKLVGQMNKLLERYEKALKKIIEQDGMGADLSPAGSCCEVAREALNREK